MAKKDDAIFIQIDNERIELTGADKDAFIADQKAREEEAQLLEAEYEAKKQARENAIKKLADIAGLTQDEITTLII